MQLSRVVSCPYQFPIKNKGLEAIRHRFISHLVVLFPLGIACQHNLQQGRRWFHTPHITMSHKPTKDKAAAQDIHTKVIPVLGIDRLELNVFGSWTKEGLNSIWNLPLKELVKFNGVELARENGSRHGPDFCPFRLHKKDCFRIDIFEQSTSGYAGRFFLYSQALSRHGLSDAVQRLRVFSSELGCCWNDEQLSRIDMCADIAKPFCEFRKRMDARCYVSHLKEQSRLGRGFETSRAIGDRKYVFLNIYDKALEKGVAGPLTRVEFRAGRKWLARQQVSSLAGVDIPGLWTKQTSMIRLTDQPPDKTHQSRFATWPVWDAVERAEWSRRDTFPQKEPKRTRRKHSPKPIRRVTSE